MSYPSEEQIATMGLRELTDTSVEIGADILDRVQDECGRLALEEFRAATNDPMHPFWSDPATMKTLVHFASIGFIVSRGRQSQRRNAKGGATC